MKKFGKIFGLIILIFVSISLVAFVVEVNYCHYDTTTPPFGAPPDYINTGALCQLNSIILLPGIAIGLGLGEFIELF